MEVSWRCRAAPGSNCLHVLKMLVILKNKILLVENANIHTEYSKQIFFYNFDIPLKSTEVKGIQYDHCV